MALLSHSPPMGFLAGRPLPLPCDGEPPSAVTAMHRLARSGGIPARPPRLHGCLPSRRGACTPNPTAPGTPAAPASTAVAMTATRTDALPALPPRRLHPANRRDSGAPGADESRSRSPISSAKCRMFVRSRDRPVSPRRATLFLDLVLSWPPPHTAQRASRKPSLASQHLELSAPRGSSGFPLQSPPQQGPAARTAQTQRHSKNRSQYR